MYHSRQAGLRRSGCPTSDITAQASAADDRGGTKATRRQRLDLQGGAASSLGVASGEKDASIPKGSIYIYIYIYGTFSFVGLYQKHIGGVPKSRFAFPMASAMAAAMARGHDHQ